MQNKIMKNLNIINRYVNKMIYKQKSARKKLISELEQQILIDALNSLYKELNKNE